jgi:hypothetical protein
MCGIKYAPYTIVLVYMKEVQETRKIDTLMSTPVKEVQKRYQLELTRYQQQIARVKKILLLLKNKAAAA